MSRSGAAKCAEKPLRLPATYYMGRAGHWAIFGAFLGAIWYHTGLAIALLAAAISLPILIYQNKKAKEHALSDAAKRDAASKEATKNTGRRS